MRFIYHEASDQWTCQYGPFLGIIFECLNENVDAVYCWEIRAENGERMRHGNALDFDECVQQCSAFLVIIGLP